MNSASERVKNYLLIVGETNDVLTDFVKVAASLVQKKKIVLLFTRKHVDFMSVLAPLAKEQMQSLIISYQSDVKEIVNKVLELHDWIIVPDLVILDLNSYSPNFESLHSPGVATKYFKDISFCISALFSYMKSIEVRKNTNQSEAVPVEYCAKSVTLINAIQHKEIQMLIDFYYYKSAAFTDFDLIKNEILQ